MSRRSVAALVTAPRAAVALAGCTSTRRRRADRRRRRPQPAARSRSRPPTRRARSARPSAPAGTITLHVTNTGTKVTEFYLYGDGRPDHGRGREHRPGPHPRAHRRGARAAARTRPPASRAWSATASARRSPSPARPPARSTRTQARRGHRRLQALRHVAGRRAACPRPQEFVDAVKAGDVDKAKALYPVARTYWERIEPVAESFGDLDPKIDGREDDERDPGVPFTGFHRLEKDLWVDRPAARLRRRSPTSCSPTSRSCVAKCQGRRASRRVAARQRRQGAARRGRHRQDHRRGGPLLAHRPLGLRGQRRGLARAPSPRCAR